MPPSSSSLSAYDFATVCTDAILLEKTSRAARGEALLRSDVIRIIREQDALRLDRAITPDSIYAAYPRHVGRKVALKAIERAVKAIAAEEGEEKAPAPMLLLKRTRAFAEAVAKWTPGDRAYIPHPSTWYNQGRYADDPKEWERGAAHVNGNGKKDYAKF